MFPYRATSNSSVNTLVGKKLILSNYSQTEIMITAYYDYPTYGGSSANPSTNYFFNKHQVEIQLQKTGGSDPFATFTKFTIIEPSLQQSIIQFDYSDVLSPVTSSPQELLNIINGWLLYVSGVSINGGTSTGFLNTINLIEGPNITIAAVSNVTTNVLDVTVSAAGGSGEDPFPKILMLMGG